MSVFDDETEYEDIPEPVGVIDNSDWLAEDAKGKGKTVRKGAWRYSPYVVEFVAEMLGRRYRKTDIHQWIYKQAGYDLKKKKADIWFYKPSMTIVNRLMSDARESLKQRLSVDAVEQKGTAIEFYETIIRDLSATPTERLRAQERIDSILGSDAKYGQKTDSAEVLAKKLREALDEINNVTNADEE